MSGDVEGLGDVLWEIRTRLCQPVAGDLMGPRVRQDYADEVLAAARTRLAAYVAAERDRAVAEALDGAAEALNVEGLSFKPGGWGSNPADQQTLDVMVKAVAWLRERADALRAALPATQ